MDIYFSTPDIDELKKKGVPVDMHFHSSYSPDCSTSVPAIIEKCRSLGVRIAITDHNTIKGSRAAHQLDPKIVLPAVEVTTREGKDVLLYFAEHEDLEDFFAAIVEPHVRNKSSLRVGKTTIRLQDLLEAAQHWNCLVALPHPFAVGPRRSYPHFRSQKRSHLMDHIDSIEVINQAIPHKRNLSAIGWCTETGKSPIAGSDGHILSMLGSCFTVAGANDWNDFIQKVKENDTLIVGEKRKMHSHVVNMARILREKGRVIENRRIRRSR